MTNQMRQRTALREPLSFGFNVYGYLSANLGLGVAARNTVRMLLDAEQDVRLHDVDPGGGMQGKDVTLAKEITGTAESGPYSVNLFHVNPDQIPYLFGLDGKQVQVTGTIQVCVPFWELPRLPRTWLDPLRAMDLILAPTRYVETTIRADLPDANIIHFPQAVHLPENVHPDRHRFGVPEDVVAFVMSFDMRSDMERKNPLGVIDAFMTAFPHRQDVRLVIKANNVGTVPGHGPYLARLHEAASDPRVVVIDEPMSYSEVLSLYASCDVLVSLHRAEGLGLSLLEAMALGVPVIATAYSGNMDFMTEEDSCLVEYDLTPVVATTQPAYGAGACGPQSWAEPRIDQAAEWMMRLADDSELRHRLGASARAAAVRASQRAGVSTLLAESLRIGQETGRTEEGLERIRRRRWLNMAQRIARAGVCRGKAVLRTKV